MSVLSISHQVASNAQDSLGEFTTYPTLKLRVVVYDKNVTTAVTVTVTLRHSDTINHWLALISLSRTQCTTSTIASNDW